jgi:tryptophanyl-tRNA synthetase
MVEELKAHYRRGGLGDAMVKRRLEDVLQTLLAPIRERRAALARDPGYALEVLRAGTLAARDKTQDTLDELRAGLGLFAFGDNREGIRRSA